MERIRFRFGCLAVCLCLAAPLAAGELASEAERTWSGPFPTRLVGETFRSDTPVLMDVSLLRPVLAVAKEMGFNTICVDVPWGRVETAPGKFDFTWFDERLGEIERQGFYIQVKINLLGGPRLPRWIVEDERLCKRSPDGRKDENATLTYASQELNQQLARFFRATAEHFRKYRIINYSPFVSVAGEMEYHHAYYQDYSEPAQEAFREWLRVRYTTVDGLNSAWKTSYSRFDKICLSVPRDPTPPGAFDFEPAIVDFFKFREDSLDEYFKMFAESIRAGDPKAKVALTIGRIFTPDCARRNSFSAYRWLRHADVLWTDPAPVDCYPFRMAEARAAQLVGKSFAIEVDGLYAYIRDKTEPLQAYSEQSRITFQSGASILTTSNWHYASNHPNQLPTEFQRHADIHRAIAAARLPEVSPPLPPAMEAVYVSKWTMFAAHGFHGPYASIEKAFMELYGKGERLVDVVSDDLFIPDPKILKRYTRIHIPYAPVVSDEAMVALEQSGTVLEAPGPWGQYNEYGKDRPSP